MSWGGGPHEPSAFLAGIGKGRFVGRGIAVLEHHDGSGWREVARFRNVRDADRALDQPSGTLPVQTLSAWSRPTPRRTVPWRWWG